LWEHLQQSLINNKSIVHYSMSKRLTCFILFLAITPVLSAQELTILDSETKNTLPGVAVFTPDQSISAVSDHQGKVRFDKFRGEPQIVLRFLGYNTRTVSFDEAEELGFVIELEQKTLSMGQMVVSASRWQQDSREVPVNIATVTPKQIHLQNPQTAADLLGVSGEVFIQKSQLGGGSPMMRGFATNRVLLAIDGVRMNNAIFRSGNLQNVISLDANNIARTEVIFGPGSVLYGSDAIGGVMSFQTLKPRLSTSGKAEISGSAMVRATSANEERTVHADVNYGLNRWAFVSSVTATDYDDQRMGSHGPDEFLRREFIQRADGVDRVVPNDDQKDQVSSGFSQYNLMQKIRFRPSNELDLNLDVHYSTTGDVPRYDRLIQRRDGELRRAEWFYGPQQWLMVNSHNTWFADKPIFDQLRVTAAFQDYEESRNDRNFGSPDFRNRQEQVKVLSVNFDFEKKLTEKSTLYYGAEGIGNWIDSEATETNIETGAESRVQTRYPDGSTWQSYAGFVNYKNNLSEKWTITGGLRYNQFIIDAAFTDEFFDFPFDKAEVNNGAFTGSFGTVFRPDKTWQINTHISTGFRAPNIDDIGKVFDSEPGSVVVPNPDLESEYAWNFEAGIKKNIAQILIFDLTGFYTILNDAMVRRDFTLNGQESVNFDGTLSQVQAIQNASEAWVWGLQAGVELQFSDAINLSSRINIQEGEEEDENGNNEPLRHVAPTFGTTHLTFDFDKGFTVDVYADYSGEIPFSDLAPSERGKPHLYAIDENGNPYSPGWYTLNVKGNIKVGDNTTISAGVENITDQRYRTYSSGIAAPGINAIVGVRSTF